MSSSMKNKPTFDYFRRQMLDSPRVARVTIGLACPSHTAELHSLQLDKRMTILGLLIVEQLGSLNLNNVTVQCKSRPTSAVQDGTPFFLELMDDCKVTFDQVINHVTNRVRGKMRYQYHHNLLRVTPEVLDQDFNHFVSHMRIQLVGLDGAMNG